MDLAATDPGVLDVSLVVRSCHKSMITKWNKINIKE
jgi:hypothetical protein